LLRGFYLFLALFEAERIIAGFEDVVAAREPRPKIERVENLAAKILLVAVAVILGLVGFWRSAQDRAVLLRTAALQHIQEQLSYSDLPI
jgi:hypothetical protein